MMSITSRAVLLERSQLKSAQATLSQAFCHDPVFRYFFAADEQARLNTLRGFSDIVLRYGLPYNHIYTTPDAVKGIAAWIPPGQYPLNDFKLLLMGTWKLLFQARWSRLNELFQFFVEIEGYHKRDMAKPHWYLQMLGVSPNYQNQGIGSLLLQPVLQQSDCDGLPCYLETSTEGALRFYQRHGFEVLRTGGLPDSKLPFWTLVRQPNTRNQTSD